MMIDWKKIDTVLLDMDGIYIFVAGKSMGVSGVVIFSIC